MKCYSCTTKCSVLPDFEGNALVAWITVKTQDASLSVIWLTHPDKCIYFHQYSWLHRPRINSVFKCAIHYCIFIFHRYIYSDCVVYTQLQHVQTLPNNLLPHMFRNMVRDNGQCTSIGDKSFVLNYLFCSHSIDFLTETWQQNGLLPFDWALTCRRLFYQYTLVDRLWCCSCCSF